MAVDIFRDRSDAFVGEAPEGVGDQFEIGVEMPRSGVARQAREPGRVAMGGDEVRRPGERATLDAPPSLPPEDAAGHVAYDVTDERRRQIGLHRAEGAVRNRGPGRLDGRGAVGQVIGDHLVGVFGGSAVGRQVSSGPIGDRPGHVECCRRPGHIWGRL
jgi:hypothetical protein